MGITYLWALILGLGILFFPESPRYDYRHGKAERAVRTLSKIYGVPPNHRALRIEFEAIKEKYEEEIRQGEVTWAKLFRAPRMRSRIAVGMSLQALQQLTGANYFFYYGTTIFKGAGISNSYVTQMILGGVNFGTTFLGLYLIERYGRRKSLITGALWMFICFMVFASVGHFSLDRDNPERTPKAGTAMVVFACLFILGFASTWGPMVWTIVTELYPSEFRARAMSLATASNWLWNFLLAFFTPFIVSAIDFQFGYVFAGCLLLAAGLVYFAVIEGQGRTLEEIDTMYVMKIEPWKSSKFKLRERGDKNSPGNTNTKEARTPHVVCGAAER
jgi:MFS transporter, SP family, sugar:H+ symporter